MIMENKEYFVQIIIKILMNILVMNFKKKFIILIELKEHALCSTICLFIPKDKVSKKRKLSRKKPQMGAFYSLL